MERIELLWRAYEMFELAGANKQLARRAIDEQRPRCNAAKAALPERRARLAGLLESSLALPPGDCPFLQLASVPEYHWEARP